MTTPSDHSSTAKGAFRYRPPTTVLPPVMSDRTESLLAELVELQRRQISNQEQALARQDQALARQEHAISVQQQAVDRQKSAVRRLWLVIVIATVVLAGLPVLSWAISWVRFLPR